MKEHITRCHGITVGNRHAELPVITESVEQRIPGNPHLSQSEKIKKILNIRGCSEKLLEDAF